MYKNLSLIDFINLNKGSDYYSKELKKLLLVHGSLEYNIKKHIRLLNKIPEINESRKNTKWYKSRSFHLLMQKIQEIEARIDNCGLGLCGCGNSNNLIKIPNFTFQQL